MNKIIPIIQIRFLKPHSFLLFYLFTFLPFSKKRGKVTLFFRNSAYKNCKSLADSADSADFYVRKRILAFSEHGLHGYISWKRIFLIDHNFSNSSQAKRVASLRISFNIQFLSTVQHEIPSRLRSFG